MSEKEKSAVKKLSEAMNILPDDKRNYILGYAEGVIAASGKREDGGDQAASSREAGG